LTCDEVAGICKVKPRVKIVDNWGWCSEGGGVSGPCPEVDPSNETKSGYCVNANRTRNGDRCWSDNTVMPFRNEKICTNSLFPYCDDGWYESNGQIIVYKQ
jgi:hypothetical protein